MTQREKLRRKVYDKYEGKCAYTGEILPLNWEIDHLTPMPKGTKGIRVINSNNFQNLMPTFKFINLFKKDKNLEEWREYLLNFHFRLVNKTVNGKDVRVRAKHKDNLMKFFNIKMDNPFCGVFYFETIKIKEPPFSRPIYHHQNYSIDNIKGEIWSDIKKYKSYYSVSNLGRLKCPLRVDSKGQTRKEIIKRQQVSKEGYLASLFSADKVRRTERVDIIVANEFVSNPDNLPYLHHKNGNKLDTRASNLFWSNRKVLK